MRRSTTAARLKALFGDVDEIDAFTGMISEPHVAGTEFGELQLAMWTQQFRALRDGDRFFYGNDPALDAIAEAYGVDYRRSLGDVIAANTDIASDELPASVFQLATVDQTPDAAAESGDDEADEPAAGALDDAGDRRSERGDREQRDHRPGRARPGRRPRSG